MAIDATVGGANANAYMTYARWQALIVDRPNTPAATSGALQATVEQAIMKATRDIEVNACWNIERVGYPAATSQALRFPAFDVLKRRGDQWYDSATIPDFIEFAVLEQSIRYLEGDPTGDAEASATRGVQRVKADTVEVEFDAIDTTPASVGAVISEAAARELAFWVTGFSDGGGDVVIADILAV